MRPGTTLLEMLQLQLKTENKTSIYIQTTQEAQNEKFRFCAISDVFHPSLVSVKLSCSRQPELGLADYICFTRFLQFTNSKPNKT